MLWGRLVISPEAAAGRPLLLFASTSSNSKRRIKSKVQGKEGFAFGAIHPHPLAPAVFSMLEEQGFTRKSDKFATCVKKSNNKLSLIKRIKKMAFNPLKKVNVQSEQVQSFMTLESTTPKPILDSNLPKTEPSESLSENLNIVQQNEPALYLNKEGGKVEKVEEADGGGQENNSINNKKNEPDLVTEPFLGIKPILSTEPVIGTESLTQNIIQKNEQQTEPFMAKTHSFTAPHPFDSNEPKAVEKTKEDDYFEGSSLDDLESTGINTISSLASAATPKITATEKSDHQKNDINGFSTLSELPEASKNKTAAPLFVQSVQSVNEEQDKKESSEDTAQNQQIVATTNELPEEHQIDKTRPLTEEQKKLEKQAKFRALKNLVNEIQINLVLDELGASTHEDKVRGKRKVDGVGNFGVSGQQWYNLNYMGTENAGGAGAVGLIQHYLAITAGCSLYDKDSYRKFFAPAVYWLAKNFGEAVNSDDIKASLQDMQRIEKKDKIFSPPEPDDSVMEGVKKYLVEERFIPEAIVDKQIKEGKIYGAKYRNYIGAYEDYKKDPDPQFVDVRLAVFIAKAKTIAELRSIDAAYPIKKLAGGATRSHGFTVVHDFEGADNKISSCEGVSVVEAAVDAMSYSVFYPKRFVISSAGVNAEFAVKCAIITLNEGKNFFLAFDNDKAGNDAAKIFKESLVDKIGQPKFDDYVKRGLLKRHRAKHGKDWNEDLEFLHKQNMENSRSQPKESVTPRP